MKQKQIILLLFVIVLLAWFIAPGFSVRKDVYLEDYAVPLGQNEMTITVGVAGSAGYTRAVKNVSSDPKVMKLQFYSAFGGVNGSVGETHVFVLYFAAECEEIHFLQGDAFAQVLKKDAETGQWERVS